MSTVELKEVSVKGAGRCKVDISHRVAVPTDECSEDNKDNPFFMKDGYRFVKAWLSPELKEICDPMEGVRYPDNSKR